MPKKPMAVWMAVTVAVAGLLITAGMSKLPQAVQAAYECRRGLAAQQEGRHWTAVREYEQALERVPGSVPVMARLAVSYFHNEKMVRCSELLERIKGKRLERRLAEQINDIVGKLDSSYHESAGLLEALELYGREELEKTAAKLEAYLSGREKDVMGLFHLANINYDIGDYEAAEALYGKVLLLEPQFYTARLNLAAVYRIKGSFDKSEACCMQVLERNKEHPQALVALSKLKLAQGDYLQGLEYAKKAYEYDNEDTQTAANLCIAYDYNGMTDERDRLFQSLQQKDYNDLTALKAIFLNKK